MAEATPVVPAQVPAAVLAEPEPDRAAVEAVAPRGLLPELRFLCAAAAGRVHGTGSPEEVSRPIGHLDDRGLPYLPPARLPRVLCRQSCIAITPIVVRLIH